jgi:endonuclease/exonuclease/phosphatase (EEP) superfamily protein YafD
VPELLDRHVGQMDRLRALVAADRNDPSVDALVVGGDFNASPMSFQYRRLRDAGLVSAHERVGRGFATTWPNLAVPIPPMRLDHVFVAGRIEPVSVREGEGEGSDHLPVFVELSLDP